MKKALFILFLSFFVLIGSANAQSICIKEGKTFNSSQNPGAECCGGLQEKSQYDLNTCTALPSLDYICIKCGDGACGSGENKCNCPEDCAEVISPNPDSKIPTCYELYWFDNTNKNCDKKQFCGAYMWQGLRTFEAKEDCLAALSGSTSAGESNSCLKEGETLGYGSTINCCEGLNPISHAVMTQDGTCASTTGSYQICAACGNGVCGSSENKCNCPQDCNLVPNTCSTGCVCSGGSMICPTFQNQVKAKINVQNNAASTQNTTTVMMGKNDAGQVTIKSGDVEATSADKVTVVENKLYIENSNGKNSEVKIMPETASEKAIERLGDLGFNIELKEVGQDDNAKPVYSLGAEKQVKLLGFIKLRMRINAEVDAQTGEVISVKKPWWSFLAW